MLTRLCSIFLSYIIDLGTHHLDGPASWRIPVGLQLLWGVILLSGIFFLPESPCVYFFSYDPRFTHAIFQTSSTWYRQGGGGP